MKKYKQERKYERMMKTKEKSPSLKFLSVLLTTIVMLASLTPIEAEAKSYLIWAKTYGGSNLDDYYDTMATSDGGSIAVGLSTSSNGDLTGIYKGGGEDAIYVKYNSSGSIVWKKSFGGTGDDGFKGITPTSDGGFIAVGHSSSTDGDMSGITKKGGKDAVIAKFNSSGTVQWKRVFGGTGVDYLNSATQLSNGNIVVVGETTSVDGDLNGLVNYTGNDAYVLVYNSSGTLLSKQVYGGSLTDRFLSVEATSDGGYIIAGYTHSNNGYFTGSKGSVDAILMKFSSTNTVQWKRNYGGTGDDDFRFAIQTSDGGYIVAGLGDSTDGDLTGMNKGDFDAYLVKYNSSGSILWKRNFGGSLYDAYLGLTVMSDGDFIPVGRSVSTNGDFTGMNKGDSDAFAVRYNSSGTLLDKYSFGGTNFELFNMPKETTDGNIVLVGNSTSSGGDLSTTNKGSHDAISVKLGYDTTAPTINLSPSTTAPTNQNVTVTATISDSESGVQVKKWASGSQTTSWFTSSGTTLTGSTVSISANGTYSFYAQDEVGNARVATITISNIDKTPPANATFTASTTSPTNQDVSVTISYPSDASIKQYKIGSTGTWTTYSSPVALSSNNTIYARSFDNAGNVSSETSLTVSNIDKVVPTTPTISATPTTATNGNVVVTATFPSDATVKEYRLNGGTWTTYSLSVTMTANGTFEARGKDQAGNYSAIASYSVSNIDKTPPANATFSASTTAPTNQNVTVTISYPSDASTKQYKLGSTGTWTTYSAPVVVSSNNTVYARSYDAVGNVSNETSYTVSNIDKVAPTTPTLSADTTDLTNGNVVVTATFPSDAVTKEVRLNGGSWSLYTTAITMTTNGKVEARGTDNAGNISTIGSYDVTNIDKTPPANATLSPSTTAPTNQNVSVTIAYPNDAYMKEYKLGSTGTWTAYTAPVSVSSNNTIYARSKDEAGNMSAESSLSISNIDKVAPTTPIISADVTDPTNGNVVLTASFPNDASVKEYRLNGGTWTAYSTSVTMTANGTFEARGKDLAGNYSSIASYSVSNIDKTPPANATLSANTTNPTNQNVSVTISYPSDATVKQYKIGSTGTWTSYTVPVVVTSNNTVYARSYDEVGNLSNETSLVVSNIDKVAPTTPTLSADITTPTNGNVVVTVTFPADAVTKEVRINSGSWTAYTTAITMTANGKVEVRGTDNAGNVSGIGVYDVTNIDKTPPANATFTANTTAPTNQNVTLTINYPSDATVKQYKIGSTGTWTSYTSPMAISSNNTIYARSYDVAGNISNETSYSVTNIDKVAPATPTLTADGSSPTNRDVTVTASFPSDSYLKEVRVNGGTWNVYTTPVIMTANGKVEVRATDNAGNVSEIGSYDVTNIDKTPPVNATITPSTTSPTNQNVTVTISYPSDAKVKEYKIGSAGTWTAYTSQVTVSSNNTVYARSTDEAGNMSGESSLVVSNIDKVAPITPIISPDVTIPTNGNVSLSVNYPSDASTKEYRINGGAWTAYTMAVTITANGTFEARARDLAGNYSTIASYTVENIDKTPPANATLLADKTGITNQDVIVTITYPTDAVIKQYKIGLNGTWTAYTSPVVLSGNNTVFTRSYDGVGNASAETSLVVNNIDKVAPLTPSISADKTEPTNSNIILTASFPSDASVKEYRINGGAWTSYTISVTMTANGTFEARGKDLAGNYSEIASFIVSNIDKTPPINATLSADKTSPTNTNVLISISYPSDASVKQYRIGSTGTWMDYTSPVTMSANGTIYARSMDAVGNVSAETSYTVSNIDKVAPNKPTITPDRTSATNGNVTLTVAYSGDSSVKEYRIESGNWTAYVNTVIMTANGIFEARGKDQAGNYSEIASYAVSNIDKTPPGEAVLTPSTTVPTNQNVTVSIIYPTDASVKEYKVGSTGTWIAYTAPITLSSNNTVYARSKDAVGNISVETSLEINNIDKVVPTTPTISADVTVPTNGNVVLTANYPSDAYMKEYRLNGGAWTAYTKATTMTVNGTMDARAKDEAGNYSAIGTYTVSNIDKTPPVNATLNPSTTAPTNQDVTVTISYPSDASVKQYKIESTGTWTTYATPVALSANHTVFARSFDAVGNLSAESSLVVDNIDKVAPNQPTILTDVTAPTNGNVILTVVYPSDAHLKEYRLNSGSWTAYTTAVTITANGTFEARAKDVAGNYSEVASYTIENIDKTAPEKATFSADQTQVTNQDVNLTILYPSDASVKQYKLSATGSWKPYDSTLVISENTVIFARSYDAVGNLSAESSYDVNNIDKVKPVAPTFSADRTAPTNQNVTVTVAFPSDTVKKEVSVNGGSWTNYSSPTVFTSNGYIEARGTDQAGNISDVTRYNVTNIDKTKPQSPSFDVSSNENMITLSGDKDSKHYYRLNDGVWTLYSAPIVTDDGEYNVEFKSIDLAKNESLIVIAEIQMYRDTLSVANEMVNTAEEEQTQESVDQATEQVNLIPSIAPEYQPLMNRIKDIQALIDVRKAIEVAIETRDPADVELAKEKVGLLNNNNPIIVDLIDDIQTEIDEADILMWVAKERFDILSSKYEVSKESYTALVNIYYAIKYTGDFMYKTAKDKVALVPDTDKHHDFVDVQFEKLSEKYNQFVQNRIQTDAEIKAENSVKTMETKYDPSMAVTTQQLINAVEDATIRTNLQQRLDSARLKYETSLLSKGEQDAVVAVEKAEQYKSSFYVTEAYKKVNALTNEELKVELTVRLQLLESQMALDKLISDARKSVELAEQYPTTTTYLTSAQTKVNALPDVTQKAELQVRLDKLKAGLDQTKVVKDANSAVSLAQSMKTKYYVDKARVAISLVLDESIRLDLTKKVDAIVVK